ncbi:MAG: hypothetical protein BGO01_00100 [Armatimonadetes bacterium 55-13]|nr:MAG: hypothetical protein BGO01_00100 [Armatimonadetes bacterium 55-13]
MRLLPATQLLESALQTLDRSPNKMRNDTIVLFHVVTPNQTIYILTSFNFSKSLKLLDER